MNSPKLLPTIEDDINALEAICDRLSKDWPAGHGHRVMHALKKLSGKMIPHGVPEIPHRVMFSIHNSYAPWAVESHLTPLLEEIQPRYYRSHEIPEHTLVDIYRFWSLYEALDSLREIKGDVIEVGVYRGGTSALIGHVLQQQDAHLFLCDTFTGVVKATTNDTAYVGGEHADTTLSRVESLVSKYLNRDRFTILQGVFPDQTSDAVAGKRFKFCHIDVDVYQSAKDVFEYVWPRMVNGGIVILDDYATQGLEGMTRMCNELKGRDDCASFHMFNGQFMMIKREKTPSLLKKLGLTQA